MKKLLLPFFLLAGSLAWAGTKLLAPTNLPNSGSLPATCSTGDAYMKTSATSGQQWYMCESANNWVLEGGGGGSGTPGGIDKEIQFNDGGSFNGIAQSTFDKTTNSLTFGTTTTFANVGFTQWTGISSVTYNNGITVGFSTGAVLNSSGTVTMSTVTIQGGGIFKLKDKTANQANAKFVAFTVGTSLTKNTTYQISEDGSNGQWAQTNGAGVVSWHDGWIAENIVQGTCARFTTASGSFDDGSQACAATITLDGANRGTQVEITACGEVTNTNSSASNAVYATIFENGSDISSGNGFAYMNEDNPYNTVSATMICMHKIVNHTGHGSYTYSVAIRNTDASTTVQWGQDVDATIIAREIYQ